METSIWAIVTVVTACVFGALGALMLKKGSEKFDLNIKKQLRNTYLIIGIFIYAVTTIFFIVALKYGELSVLYPLVATTYIWVVVFSIKFLKESMNIWKWLGVVSIVVGVVLIGIGS